MEKIGYYIQQTEFTNEHAGTSEWCIAEKDGKRFFVKKMQKPVYPSDSLGLPPDKYQKRVDRFNAKMARYNELYAALNAANESGTLIVPETVIPYQFHICSIAEYFSGNIRPEEIHLLSPWQRLVLMRTLTLALMDVHNAGVVHADLKPDNVLVYQDENTGVCHLKLIDFDGSYFAKAAPGNVDDIGGDMAYWAPEICAKFERDNIPLDEKLDNFALGIILHYMWCGALPEKPADQSLGQFVYEGNIPRLNDNIPAPLAEIIQRLLIADPQKRMSCEQAYCLLGEQLAQYPQEVYVLHASGHDPTPPGGGNDSPGDGRNPHDDPHKEPHPPGGSEHRHKELVILLLVALALAIIIVIAFRMHAAVAPGNGGESITEAPGVVSTTAPAISPTILLTFASTEVPTAAPTRVPTRVQTSAPTRVPTSAPTRVQTAAPTRVPTRVQTSAPTRVPTRVQTSAPTRVPTAPPTKASTYVVADSGDTNVRSGPGLSYTSIGVLKKGTQVHYLNLVSTDERGVDWYRIEYNGNSAWVSSRYTKLISGGIDWIGSVSSSYVKAAAGQSYVRSGPGKGYQTMGVMKKGTSAPYLNETATDERGVKWYKISYNGKEGWVSSRYTELR